MFWRERERGRESGIGMGVCRSDYGVCRDHPNQKHVPGVCSACLRERLALISSASRARFRSNSTVDSMNFYSISSSGPYSDAASPTVAASEFGFGSSSKENPPAMSFSMPLGLGFEGTGGEGLRKCRSVAVVPVRRRTPPSSSAGLEAASKKRRWGLWNWKRLLLSTGKRAKAAVTNSMVVKEKAR